MPSDVLRVLGGLAKTGAAGYAGYSKDQQLNASRTLAALRELREGERDRVLNLLTQRQIARPQLGDKDYGKVSGEAKAAETAAETPALVARASALKPVRVAEAVEMHTGERRADVANPMPQVSVQAPSEVGDPAIATTVTARPGQAPDVRTAEIPGSTKGGGGAGGNTRALGAGGIFGAGSALGSVEEMRTIRPRMEHFELGLLAAQPDDPGIKLFDVYRQNILDAANHASGGHGAIAQAVSNATRTFAADERVRQNPQLLRYAKDVARWIVSDLNLSRNASDERGRMDVIASSVLGDPVSDMDFGQRRQYIQDVISTRRSRMRGLERAAPAAERTLENIAGSGRRRSTASADDPEFDAMMAGLQPPAKP